MELQKVNAEDYGLEEHKAAEISAMFKPMLDKMVELETEYNKIINLEKTPENCSLAKELRLKYVKIRTETAAKHKQLKAFYLQGGRFVDGLKNAQLMASEGIEDSLKQFENHFEIIEAERIKALQEERKQELTKYLDDQSNIPDNLGFMTDELWSNFLLGAKTNYENRLKAAEEVEKERLKQIELDEIERNRTLEIAEYKSLITEYPGNLRFMKNDEYILLLTDLKEKKRVKEEETAKITAENEALRLKQEADKKLFEERSQILKPLWNCMPKKYNQVNFVELSKEEFDKMVSEAKIALTENEARLEKERKENERIAAELLAKQTKEKEEAEKQELEASKGDAEKIEDLIKSFEVIKTKYSFKSKKNQLLYANVGGLIDKTIAYIKEK